jgi:hypothetical protein
MEFSDDERDMLLAALFELRITHAEDDEKGTQIKGLVEKLGGDYDTHHASRHTHRRTPRHQYPSIRLTRPTKADAGAPYRAFGARRSLC